MTFINTIAVEQAGGAVREMYQQEQGDGSYVPNYAQVFCHRPGVMSAWAALLKEIRGPVDPRRFQLITLAAAQELKSSYCSLAYGTKLLKNDYSSEQLKELLTDVDAQVLDAKDKAMMKFARQVVRDQSSITAEDVAELRALGFDDAEIFDIVVVAAARCFFAKIPDALGVRPDSDYQDLDESIKQVLVVGRPIEEVRGDETGKL